MIGGSEKISLRQLQTLLILDILGTGVIVLPRRAAQWAGPDGWAVIVLSALFALCSAYLLMTVCRIFPGESFLSYCGKTLSKPVAVAISLGFVAKILIGIAMEARFFTEILKQTMLRTTPFSVIFAGLALISAYAAAMGYETRARAAELLLPVVFAPLFIVLALAAVGVDATNLLPVLRTPPERLAVGGFLNLMSFSGLELCLLANPFLAKPLRARRSVMQAVAIIGGGMLIITLVTIARFGPADTARQMWPVIEMMDVIDFPGAFIERQDALIMSFWIVSAFAMMNAGLFFAATQLKEIFKKGARPAYVLLCVPAVYAAALIPENIEAVYGIMEFMFVTFGIAYMLFLPMLLIAVAKLRGLGETNV